MEKVKHKDQNNCQVVCGGSALLYLWLSTSCPRPQRAWMVKPLALAEMPKVYHRVRQGFQGIVQFTDALETDQ